MQTRLMQAHPGLWALLAALLVPAPDVLHGQSPDPNMVKVPGWTPADRVSPSITVSTRQDPRTKIWAYTYRVSNGPSANQSLIKLGLVLDVPVESAKAPDGWWAATYNPPAALPGVTFAAEQEDSGAWPGAAAPGGKTLTFTVLSRYGPGTIQYYARGNPPSVSLDDLDPAAQARLPTERQDAIRGSTIGPVR